MDIKQDCGVGYRIRGIGSRRQRGIWRRDAIRIVFNVSHEQAQLTLKPLQEDSLKPYVHGLGVSDGEEVSSAQHQKLPHYLPRLHRETSIGKHRQRVNITKIT